MRIYLSWSHLGCGIFVALYSSIFSSLLKTKNLLSTGMHAARYWELEISLSIGSQLIQGFMGDALQHPRVALLLEDPRAGTSYIGNLKSYSCFLSEAFGEKGIDAS
jgi:hypothetical protein